jgi:hypothetical protein
MVFISSAIFAGIPLSHNVIRESGMSGRTVQKMGMMGYLRRFLG